MAIQLINIGQIANDGTGDDLREAMVKINQNFEELDLRDDEQTTASNLGAVGEGVFFNRVNYDLQFKKIAGGDNITLSADNEKIVINASNVVTDITVNADSGSVVLDTSASLTIVGGADISTSINNSVLTITNEYVSEIVEDTTPQLGGDLDAQGFNILNLGTATNVVTDITVNADSGSVVLDTSASLTIVGGADISTSINNSVLTITNEYVSEIVEDTTPQLGGDLDAQGFNILNLGTATGSFVGNLTGNVNGVDPAATAYYFNNIDLGNISLTITNIIDLLAATVDVDQGTYGNPAAFNIDLGSI